MISKARLTNYFDLLYPDAHCELNHSNPFELLIAVMLSAQTTDKAVNKITPVLFKKFPTIDDFTAADILDIENIIHGIGIYKNKARRIKNMALQLKANFNGQVPSTLEELITLDGVGRKTASVVLIVAFNIPAFPVDTHVERVSKRLGLTENEDDVLKVEQKLRKFFKPDEYKKIHHQMIFFGRYHCKAIKPNCQNCELKTICKYEKKS